MTFPDVRPCGVEIFGLKTREALSAREGRDLSHPIAQSPSLTDEESPAQRGE